MRRSKIRKSLPEGLQVSSVNRNSTKLPLLLRVTLIVLGIIFWLVVRSWLATDNVHVRTVQEQSGRKASSATAPSPVQTPLNNLTISNLRERQ